MTLLDWKKIAHTVLLSRELDRLEIEQLTPQGKVKYQFLAGGHELSQVLLAHALDHPRDAAAVYYRSRPFLLASGLTAEEALASGMARMGGTTDGRDVGVTHNMPRRHGAVVLPMSGAVGAQYTPAAGYAQAIQYRAMNEPEWRGAIAVALGGDGSVAANGFWASLNIVTTLRLPYLFFIEDNNYGISVPSSLQTPGGSIAENLASFKNLKIIEADGTDPKEASESISKAVRYVRGGNGACLLRLRVVRLLGHTFIDTQEYKTKEEREGEAARDPVPRLRQYLIRSKKMAEGEWNTMRAQIQKEVSDAAIAAETHAHPDPKEIVRHNFFTGAPPQHGGIRAEGVEIPLNDSAPKPEGARINFIEAVKRAMIHEMTINPRLLLFGEDVGVKGGVHGATLDMQKKFGVERVFDTSLSEEGIMGRAAGMAYAGLMPLPEIQFRKYADPAHEQITDIGTVRWRTANRFAAPMVVRIPVGYSRKTGDPWHSISGEAIFAHLVGWRIAYPSNAEDAVGLIRSAMRGDDPTIFLEHRVLLDGADARRPYPGDDYCVPFGKASTVMQGDELTVITWGEMVHRCVEAASPFERRVDILDLRTIIPWDREAVLESVKRTGKVLIVHEDTITGGFAGEITSVIAREAFTYLDAPIERMATPDVPIPYSVPAMNALLPSVEKIRKKMERLLEF